MKRNLFKIIGVLVLCILLAGCGEKINKDSPLYKAKENMVSNVDNYDLKMSVTMNTDAGDVSISGDCKEDRKNETSYCKTTTLGVGTETYTDYKNKKTYSRVSDDYGLVNSSWTAADIKDVSTDQWLELNDFIFDVKEEESDGLTKYSGTIDIKKITGLLNRFDMPVDLGSFLSKDVAVEVYVNDKNYIDSMKVDLEVLGISMDAKLEYSNYNSAGNVVIPDNVK